MILKKFYVKLHGITLKPLSPIVRPVLQAAGMQKTHCIHGETKDIYAIRLAGAATPIVSFIIHNARERSADHRITLRLSQITSYKIALLASIVIKWMIHVFRARLSPIGSVQRAHIYDHHLLLLQVYFKAKPKNFS